MSFTDQATLAADTSFQLKVRVAVVTAAKDVMGEAKGSMSDTVFGKRQQFAYQVISSSLGYLDRFVWAVVANPAITGASSDGDIQFTVNTVWDDLSGVTITD
jgi:hypothetical protein